MEKINGQITDVEVVRELWGERAVKALGNPRIAFTEETIIIRPRRPVKIKGVENDLIEFQEPTVGQMNVLDSVKGGPMAQAKVFLKTVTGMSDIEVNEVGVSTMTLFNTVFECFLGDGLETGATS